MALNARTAIAGMFLVVFVALVADAGVRGRRAARRIDRPVAQRETPALATPAAVVPEANATAAPVEEAATGAASQIDPRQAMADILSLRQAQAHEDVASSEAFTTALQRLIAEKHGAPLAQAGAVSPVVAATAGAAAPALIPSDPESQAGLITALRQSAAHFDALANEHEQRREYPAADAARETANHLRTEARRLDP